MMFFIAARQSHSPAAVRRIREGLQGTVSNLIWFIAVICQRFRILVGVDLLDDSDVVAAWAKLDRGCSEGKREWIFTEVLLLFVCR